MSVLDTGGRALVEELVTELYAPLVPDLTNALVADAVDRGYCRMAIVANTHIDPQPKHLRKALVWGVEEVLKAHVPRSNR